MSHRTKFLASVVTSVIALCSAPASATLKRQPGEANVSIKAWTSPAGSFTGGCVDKSCSGLDVTEANENIVISIPFSSIQVGTGVVFGKRTKDMLKVFGSSSRIALSIPKRSIKLPNNGQSFSGAAIGTLTLKQGGKAASKKFSYTVKRTGKVYTVSDGSLDIDLNKDFGIDTKKTIRKLNLYVKPHIAIRDVQFAAIDK